MPDPKKPSKPTSRGGSSSGGRSRKPPQAPESEYLASREDADDAGFDDESDQARPVAVGGSSGLAARLASFDDDATDTGDEPSQTSTFDEDLFALGAPEQSDQPVPLPDDGAPHIERPREEMIAAAICVLLAASTFLSWFKYGPTTQSGFGAGRFGPLVTFLGLAGFAILVARRARKPISFPVDHALVIEGIGWLSTLAILASNLMPPKFGNLAMQRQLTLFVSLVLAVGLALFAGRISASAPFVVRPGWFQTSAGKLGAAVLGIALAAGVLFGFLNGGSKSAASAPTPQAPQQIQGLPPCIKAHKFPIPRGVSGQFGYPEVQGNCVASLRTNLTLKTAYSRVLSSLKAAKWKYKTAPVQAGAAARSVILEGPRCGGVTLAGDTKGKVTTFYVALRPCTPSSPGTN